MKYENIVLGKFIARPNRFIAQVELAGQIHQVHVRNTGRCRELLVPGAQVILEDCSHIKTRKTSYSLIGVYKNNRIINMDSQIPNQVVLQALRENKIQCFQNVEKLRAEKTYKNSRFDISFQLDGRDHLMEVKGVTLEREGVALFPDAPTKRGTKHLMELIDAQKNGFSSSLVFLIQMEDISIFRPNWAMDPDFAQALSLAHKSGVKILAYNSKLGQDSIVLNQRIQVDLSQEEIV